MTASEHPDRQRPRVARTGRSPGPIDSLWLAHWARRLILPFALVLGLALFLCFGTIRVPAGMDTMPDVPPGSLCIVDKRSGSAKAGSAVFVDLPDGGTLLTRVTAIAADGRLVVHNDAAGSQLPDSDEFGPLPRSAVRGVVLVVFAGQGAKGEAIRGR